MNENLLLICVLGVSIIAIVVMEFMFDKLDSKHKDSKPIESQYTDDEIRIARYFEAKARSDARYQVFRQMMHDTARKDD